jgi:hypothetical protein
MQTSALIITKYKLSTLVSDENLRDSIQELLFNELLEIDRKIQQSQLSNIETESVQDHSDPTRG